MNKLSDLKEKSIVRAKTGLKLDLINDIKRIILMKKSDFFFRKWFCFGERKTLKNR